MPNYNLNVGGTDPTWKQSELDVHDKMAERPATKPPAPPEPARDVLEGFDERQASYSAARAERARQDADSNETVKRQQSEQDAELAKLNRK